MLSFNITPARLFFFTEKYTPVAAYFIFLCGMLRRQPHLTIKIFAHSAELGIKPFNSFNIALKAPEIAPFRPAGLGQPSSMHSSPV
jgi:hypothetical protein